MNELERASNALLHRPVAVPAPIEVIERRAGAIRRRRRLLQAGAIALAVLVLGTAGVALVAARDGDDQGVFVGEGPATAPTPSVVTYELGSPLDDATAEALQQTIEARFRWFGQGDAEVRVSGKGVQITTQAPADRISGLVTSPGGFQLRAVVAEVDPAVCEPAGSNGGDDASWTSAVAGPPRCLETTPGPVLPSAPAFESGSRWVGADGYAVTLGLTVVASRAVIDHWPTCVGPCLPDSVAVVTGHAILHPDAILRSTEQDGATHVQVELAGFTDPADAQLWASVLVHPLPAGVVWSGAASPATTATTPTTA